MKREGEVIASPAQYYGCGGVKKGNMRTLKIGLLAIFLATSLVGCVSHTHERVVEKEPASTTTVVK
jgi:hypothetical protein